MKKKYMSLVLALTGIISGVIAQENKTIKPLLSNDLSREVTFAGDVIINNMPGENQQQVKIATAFNGWLYSAYTTVNTSSGNGGITIRSSRDNGITWNTIDTYSVSGTLYTDLDLVVAGTDTTNLKLYMVAIRKDVGAGTYRLFVDQYNATTGTFNGDYYNMDHSSSPIRDVAIATDYMQPSVSSAPYSVGIMYSAGAGLDSVVCIASVDGGNSYAVRQVVMTTPYWMRNVAISYGRSASGSNGRFFGAWEELTAYTNVNAHIWSGRTTNSVSSAWSVPKNLDSLSSLMINRCKNPSIATSIGTVDNDSGAVSAVVLVQRDWTGTGGDYDLLGFYNYRAHYTDNWTRLDVDNGGDNSMEPNITFGNGTMDFCATFHDSTSHYLSVVKNNFNLATPNGWTSVTSRYNDDTVNIVNPMPNVKVNPANNQAALAWIRMNGAEGVAMFDAEYASATGVSEQHGGGFEFSNLYPNPSSNELNIGLNLPAEKQVSIQVINMLGQQILNTSNSYGMGSQLITMDVSAYPAGIYFCNVVVDNQTYTKKFVVKHD